MRIDPLFSVLYCHDHLDIDNDLFIRYANEKRRLMPSKIYSNRGGWQSANVQKEQLFIELIDIINSKVQQLHTAYGLKDNVCLKVSQMWINVNSKYNYNVNHVHPGSFFSGTYYADVPENSGDITLVNPSQLYRSYMQEVQGHNLFKNYTPFNSQYWTITPKAGTLILFPSFVEHNVSQNLSDGERISISFDITIFDKE